jgi:hypothetical protein
VKSIRTPAGVIPTVLFFVTGVFWVAIVVTGGGGLLLWAALSGFLSGVFLIVASSKWMTRPLTGASSLFGLTLTVYQLYIASTLVGGKLASVAAYSIAAFAVFTVVYLYLLFSSVRQKEES